MMKDKGIEKKVAEAVLQKAQTIEIGGQSFEVAPPSIATLILVSELISELPDLSIPDKKDVVIWSLRHAKDCKALGDIVATLILGAKGLTSIERYRFCARGTIKNNLYALLRRKRTIDKRAELSKALLEDLTPQELATLATSFIEKMEIGGFFFITSFLSEVNVIKATTTATASGQ